jgi:energy-coupling factor transporter ATP-binding protein EcfA2
MRLTRARVTNFRSIDDSGWVSFGDTTCLVGKNESGKTAFLQALARLRPVPGKPGDYDPVLDYPSKDFGRYRKTHDTEPARVAEVTFELTDDEFAEMEGLFGVGVLTSKKTVGFSKDYKNQSLWSFSTDEGVVVKHLVSQAGLSAPVLAQAEGLSTVAALSTFLGELPEPTATTQTVMATITSWGANGFRGQLANGFGKLAPRFFYFDDYSVMRGRVSVQHLKAKVAASDLDERDRNFLAFLAVGGADLEEFEDELNFERLTRELEATANSIGAQVFKYWTQNQSLRVNVQVSQANPEDEPPLNSGTILNVRIFNDRHGVTVPFDERSRGFVWFFSFFAYFSDLDADPGSLVLLLDEPGLSLHAKAQADFLTFIEERLSPDFQTIYTTHSPFLIDAARFERIRTVQDVDERGTVVSDEVFRNDSDTVFPLQAALGYELAQTLFLGPDCLLVEGPSDLIYLQVLGEAVLAKGGEPLDPRWVMVPVGGADKLSTFISLIGANQLNLAVLVDVATKDKQRIRDLQQNGHLAKNALIEVGQFVGRDDADVEDLFAAGFYLKLVNGAYVTELPRSWRSPTSATRTRVSRVASRRTSRRTMWGQDGLATTGRLPFSCVNRDPFSAKLTIRP